MPGTPSNAMIRCRNFNVRPLPYLPWRGLIGSAPDDAHVGSRVHAAPQETRNGTGPPSASHSWSGTGIASPFADTAT